MCTIAWVEIILFEAGYIRSWLDYFNMRHYSKVLYITYRLQGSIHKLYTSHSQVSPRPY